MDTGVMNEASRRSYCRSTVEKLETGQRVEFNRKGRGEGGGESDESGVRCKPEAR